MIQRVFHVFHFCAAASARFLFKKNEVDTVDGDRNNVSNFFDEKIKGCTQEFFCTLSYNTEYLWLASFTKKSLPLF